MKEIFFKFYLNRENNRVLEFDLLIKTHLFLFCRTILLFSQDLRDPRYFFSLSIKETKRGSNLINTREKKEEEEEKKIPDSHFGVNTFSIFQPVTRNK